MTGEKNYLEKIKNIFLKFKWIAILVFMAGIFIGIAALFSAWDVYKQFIDETAQDPLLNKYVNRWENGKTRDHFITEKEFWRQQKRLGVSKKFRECQIIKKGDCKIGQYQEYAKRMVSDHKELRTAVTDLAEFYKAIGGDLKAGRISKEEVCDKFGEEVIRFFRGYVKVLEHWDVSEGSKYFKEIRNFAWACEP